MNHRIMKLGNRLSKLLQFIKKNPGRFAILCTLTVAVSLIGGFLSLTGMLAVTPLLSVACLSFVFYVVYEGQIYYQHLKSAFEKLFSRDHLKEAMAKKFLLENFPQDEPRPRFFSEYESLLKEEEKFRKLKKKYRSFENQTEEVAEALEHFRLQIKNIKNHLNKKEKWFATQLLKEQSDEATVYATEYEKELQKWLEQKPDNRKAKYQQALSNIRLDFTFLGGIAGTLSALVMTTGMTYLLMDGVLSLPWLAAVPMLTSPLIIIPIAAVAGIAWGLLIYNVVTEMLYHETVQKWWTNFEKNLTSNKIKAARDICLILLAVAMTILTAGSWFYIVMTKQPLFSAMKDWVIRLSVAIFNLIVSAGSELLFAARNTNKTMTEIDETVEAIAKMYPSSKKGLLLENPQQKDPYALTKEKYAAWKKSLKKENWGQLLNPFSIITKTYFVARVLAFGLHLGSMAATVDRCPFVPQWLAIALAFIDEFIQDLHYFFGNLFGSLMGHSHAHGSGVEKLLKRRHGEEHEHDHANDAPSWVLFGIYSPFFLAGALWDWGFSKLNSGGHQLSFDDAWARQTGQKLLKTKKNPESLAKKVLDEAGPESSQWKESRIIYLFEQHEKKHLTPLIETSAFHKEVNTLNVLKVKLLKSVDRDLLQSARCSASCIPAMFQPEAKRNALIDKITREFCAPAA